MARTSRPGGLGNRDARHDSAYHRAKEQGFAARAVFKLQELDQKFKLLGPGRRALDLGCWPGSWMQYAADRVGAEGFVLGLDLKPIEIALPSWTEARIGDVEEIDPAALLAEFGPFDVVISDMAPHTTGDKQSDQFRSEALCERALFIARTVLRPGGHFAAKLFQGGGFARLLGAVRVAFGEGRAVHVAATRAGSREQYLVGQGLKANARLP
jgi:23S rRNA (uridine2552-2'-O)-methyltransferase